jgi:hypothetical protein
MGLTVRAVARGNSLNHQRPFVALYPIQLWQSLLVW